MKQFVFTAHAKNMLKERNIDSEWVDRTLSEPLFIEKREDGTTHYLKPIIENGERILRVVTISETNPWRIVTVFFDRRARRK
jgi:hypothetical protein